MAYVLVLAPPRAVYAPSCSIPSSIQQVASVVPFGISISSLYRMQYIPPWRVVVFLFLFLVIGSLSFVLLQRPVAAPFPVPSRPALPTNTQASEDSTVKHASSSPPSQSQPLVSAKQVLRPCAPGRITLQIFDYHLPSNAIVPSIDDVNDPYFRAFISSVVGRLSSPLPDSQPCSTSTDATPMDISSVRLPLVHAGDDPFPSIPSFSSPHSPATCRIDSPWLSMSANYSADPKISAVFIWNERQFLLDQVLLSGPGPSIATPLMPLTQRAFEEFAQDYADSEILQSPSEEHPQSWKAISERIPADVLWLFHKSPQSTLIPFSSFAWSAMRETAERAVAGYTELALALFDQCLTPDSAERRYENIVDVRDIIPLGKHRINPLH